MGHKPTCPLKLESAVEPAHGTLRSRSGAGCRPNQPYAIASLSGRAGAEGSPAAGMSVVGAGLNCQNGHYDAAIGTLEIILVGQRISYSRS
jgi:hypothetical protein